MDPQIASDPMISSTCIPRTLTASHVSPAPQQVDESTVRLRLVRNDDAPQLALEIGGQVVGLRRRSTVLGTGAVDLPIRDNFVSTRHARILKESGGYVVEDLDSKNGTHVDGVRVTRAWLRPGMTLKLGNWRAQVIAPEAAKASEGSGMIGRSPAFRTLVRTLEKFARINQPVLIRGETGTGKELAARELHQNSARREAPFVAVNCGAIPEGLFESELFGHVRGAFTGAHRNHSGAFARAHGGTLFLDEVAELPVSLQSKLLRVLETRRIAPVGSEREQEVDVRVVSATHQPIEERLDNGLFREDLYHRLSVLSVDLPPLRQREGDIALLLAKFARGFEKELGQAIELTEDAQLAARRYGWPGNIRELRHVIKGAALRAGGEAIRVVDLDLDRPSLEPAP
ncbi:MAG: sigma 54-interacting transcriptional regulator, partial [Nannocystaceae bacterium]